MDEPSQPSGPRRLGRLAIVHPFPSILVACVTGALATIAGGSLPQVAGLTVAMLGFQFSIGAANDVFDERDDANAGRGKPIPAGLVSRAAATWIAVLGGVAGTGISAVAGLPTLAVGLAGYAVGLAYDAGLKRRGAGPACFAIALPLVPAYAWFGAVGSVPPRLEVLVPMAAAAGIALAVANGLADLELDRAGGTRTVAARLGRGRSLAVDAVAQAAVLAVAGSTAATAGGPALAVAAVVAGAGVVVAGVACSASAARSRRELGWELQALGLGLLAAGWLAGQVIAG